MNYLDWVTIICYSLFGLLSLLTLHFMFFGVVGLFTKKTFPKADRRLRYGVVVSARNEEAVIGNLIDSIKKSDYPAELLQVFVVAHNCTDRTAEVAREAGAVVYPYTNPDERTKGYAFRYLFAQIRKDFRMEDYAGFFVFDADNVIPAEYFDKMNDCFVAMGERNIVTSFRNSKNFGSNLMSAMYGLYFLYGCRFESRGRTALGCSTRVQGTGYVVPTSAILQEDGWKYVTLTEDWELTADQIIDNTNVVYCDEANFYDEQPTTFPVMWRQRVRWARGHLLVCVTRLRRLLATLFSKKGAGKSEHKFHVYDITVNILPILTISCGIFFLQIILLLLSPLFGYSLADVALNWLCVTGIFTVSSYATLALASGMLYFLERKRIPKVSLPLKIASVLATPLFLFIAFPMEIVALFSKNLGWAPIPHKDTTSIDSLDGEKNAK